MSVIDDIAADLRDESEARAEAARQAWRYGTDDPAKLRAIHEYEARLYPESTLPCDGCKRDISVALLVSCPECGGSICADCPASCPHTPAAARATRLREARDLYAALLVVWRAAAAHGRYGSAAELRAYRLLVRADARISRRTTAAAPERGGR